jgi:hypothetical protein
LYIILSWFVVMSNTNYYQSNYLMYYKPSIID